MAAKKVETPTYSNAAYIEFQIERPRRTDVAMVSLTDGWDGGVGLYVTTPDGDEFQVVELVDGKLILRSGIDSVYMSTDEYGYVRVVKSEDF